MRMALNERAQLCEQLRDENERLRDDLELASNQAVQLQQQQQQAVELEKVYRFRMVIVCSFDLVVVY